MLAGAVFIILSNKKLLNIARGMGTIIYVKELS